MSGASQTAGLALALMLPMAVCAQGTGAGGATGTGNSGSGAGPAMAAPGVSPSAPGSNRAPGTANNLAPGATGQRAGGVASSEEIQALQDNNRRSQCAVATLPQEPVPECRLTPDAPTNNAQTPTLTDPPVNREASPR